MSDDEAETKKPKKQKTSNETKEEGQYWEVSFSFHDCATTTSSIEADKSLQLSSGRNPRRVEVSEFKNAKLVNIREFYQKDDDWLPGKKVPPIERCNLSSPADVAIVGDLAER